MAYKVPPPPTITTTQYDVLVGGSGNTIVSVGPGSSGQVLQSGGAAANPAYSTATYPSTATGTGKILRADGTNWVATTATYPDTAGTSGNVLTSDGTNWISSAAPGGGIQQITPVTLTSAQVKALRATPITILAAPGSNKVIVPIQGYTRTVYAGVNAFTNGQTCHYRYQNGSGSVAWSTVCNASQINAAATTYCFAVGQQNQSSINTGVENQPIVIHNAGASEITGNAAGDNTLVCYFWYVVVSV